MQASLSHIGLAVKTTLNLIKWSGGHGSWRLNDDSDQMLHGHEQATMNTNNYELGPDCDIGCLDQGVRVCGHTWTRIDSKDIRAKQDRIIEIATKRKMPFDVPISDVQIGSPTVLQLHSVIWPNYLPSIDSFLRTFDPDFLALHSEYKKGEADRNEASKYQHLVR